MSDAPEPSERAMAAATKLACQACAHGEDDPYCCFVEERERAAAIIDEHFAAYFAAYDAMLAALVRLVGSCARHLEEQGSTDAEWANEDYVSPLQQARAALALAEPEEPK